MIKVNNTYINKNQIDYFEENEKENNVFVHLVSGVSFLFCLDDWRVALQEYLTPLTIKNDF